MSYGRKSAMSTVEPQRSAVVSDVYDAGSDSSPDLLINNLDYKAPSVVSLVMERSYDRLQFQRANYAPGDIAIMNVNTGTNYGDPGNAYLDFDFVPSGTTAWDWGIGSAMNVINQIVIRSRSGEELDRIQRANMWSAQYTAFTNTASYLAREGLVEGWNSQTVAVTGPFHYCIPLKRLCGFFSPIQKGQKIPPQLLSGLQIEITFESGSVAYVSRTGGGASQSYAINNLSIMMDSLIMTEDVQKTINMQSAEVGLQYTYPRWFTAENPSTGTALSAQIQRAVAQAKLAFTVPALLANVTTATAYDVDSMAAEAFDVSQFQYRLGSMYFPRQPLAEKVAATLYVQGYVQALQTFDKLKHPFCESSVALSDFNNAAAAPVAAATAPAATTGAAQAIPATGGHGILCVSLEKDASLDLSGLPVNNSRILECITTFRNPNSLDNVTFLCYSAVARMYIDNVRCAS